MIRRAKRWEEENQQVMSVHPSQTTRRQAGQTLVAGRERDRDPCDLKAQLTQCACEGTLRRKGFGEKSSTAKKEGTEMGREREGEGRGCLGNREGPGGQGQRRRVPRQTGASGAPFVTCSALCGKQIHPMWPLRPALLPLVSQGALA